MKFGQSLILRSFANIFVLGPFALVKLCWFKRETFLRPPIALAANNSPPISFSLHGQRLSRYDTLTVLIVFLSRFVDRRDPKTFNLKVLLQFLSWLRSFSLSLSPFLSLFLSLTAHSGEIYARVFPDRGHREKKTWHRSIMQVQFYRFEKKLLIWRHDKTYLLLSAALPLVLSELSFCSNELRLP